MKYGKKESGHEWKCLDGLTMVRYPMQISYNEISKLKLTLPKLTAQRSLIPQEHTQINNIVYMLSQYSEYI